MIGVLADNVYSPLGRTSEQNYSAVKSGATGLRCADAFGLDQPITASLFPDGQVEADFAALSKDADGLTRFEKMLVISISDALSSCDVDAASPRTLFVISSTKGNVGKIDEPGFDSSLAASAEKVARYYGNPNVPIVVSNACISGVNAQIAAMRLLQSGDYDCAIVAGADEQSRFIVSGFQSFKALSPEECRPYDADRCGLNLGEAAATIIYSCQPVDGWNLAAGAIRNDANHISGPSRTGEGSFRVLQAVTEGVDTEKIALVNAHGTATPYNDEMESIAIERAGLSSRPVNALKGYFGHTMGAAGILETIMSMRSLDDATVLATRGFHTPGTTRPVDVAPTNRATDGHAFIKMLSGFGGCNAAILMRKCNADKSISSVKDTPICNPVHRVLITPEGAWVDGEQLPTTAKGADLLTELYRAHVKDYPKYFKMDPLSRLGFVASELLLQKCETASPDDSRAIILANRTASLCNDTRYQATISADNYFPSPALFVYTLPNIVTGEIAIRNKYYGETTFYVLPSADEALIKTLVEASMQDSATASAIGGWLECPTADDFHAEITLYEKTTKPA